MTALYDGAKGAIIPQTDFSVGVLAAFTYPDRETSSGPFLMISMIFSDEVCRGAVAQICCVLQ